MKVSSDGNEWLQGQSECLWAQKLQSFSITAGRVWVSPPPLRVSTTQFVVIDWQNSICRSQPPPKKGIEKAEATTKVTLRVTNYISIQYSLHQYTTHSTTLSITSHAINSSNFQLLINHCQLRLTKFQHQYNLRQRYRGQRYKLYSKLRSALRLSV